MRGLGTFRYNQGPFLRRPQVLTDGSSQRVRLYQVGDGGHRLLHQLEQMDTWVKRVVWGEVEIRAEWPGQSMRCAKAS